MTQAPTVDDLRTAIALADAQEIIHPGGVLSELSDVCEETVGCNVDAWTPALLELCT